jgi:glutamate dehydrogenase
MSDVDPALRRQRLQSLLEELRRQPDGRELLIAFAEAVIPQLPDPIIFRLEPEQFALEVREYFRFVIEAMPSPDQLYKGLPGLHVRTRNPLDDDQATLVETHTPHVPFIFESLKNYCQHQSLRVFSAIHPVFTVRRQWERIVAIGGPTERGARELYCRFRIERIDAADRLRRIEHEVFSILKTVFTAVEDFEAMAAATREAIQRVASRRGRAGDVETARSFLHWLLENNYVFQGMLRYRARPDAEAHPELESALGAFKDPALVPTVFPGLLDQQQLHIQPDETDERIIDIDYCTGASALHQLEPIDDLVIREWAPDGRLTAATLVVGRFSKSAFAARAQDIPGLKDKLSWLLEQSGAAPNTHAYRETRALFNRFPKRELLYAEGAALKDVLDRMIQISSDDEIAVTTRSGAGYYAVCVAFSSIHYAHQVGEELTKKLGEAFGPISFHTWADCGSSALLIFYFDGPTLEHPIDAQRIREMVRDATTTWEDRAGAALESVYGPTEGRRLFSRYVRSETRSGLYRETTPPDEVPEDVRRLEQLQSRLETRIVPDTHESFTLKLFSPTPFELIDTLRTLENLGLRVREEMAMPLVLPEGRRGFLERLRIHADPAMVTAIAETDGQRFVDALRALREGRATNDPLNGLVLREGLGWRDVEIIRMFRNHLLQIRPHYAAETLSDVLLRNSHVSLALFRYFAARFDPSLEGARRDGTARAREALNDAMARVTGLFDDEILRALANLVDAAVRTNFYQEPERPVFSVKVDSRKVEGMTSPRPLFEIYVHSRLLQGIHLRGGRVARGGIRWSDRHDDFRTEILGLMKTQMLKNAIIVPVGSKGGFVLKGQLPARPALDAYLVDRYREFIAGLLDITDNIVDGETLHPPSVVRHDEDDPYLVVAADKGTAHLSDTANHVSAQYGFWLGDAFASGGTHGYDHKKQAITARGAWVCVQHHFRMLGLDVQTEPFTMVGIGDMAGDVFGNGLLRSRTTRLIAAFNGQHIFVDPDPDPERSFVERERLFHLRRSTWRDYDAATLSPGGGVYDRQAKAITLSARAKQVLDIQADTVTGEELVKRILTAPVDLLYNGGIGTYVRATTEDETSVGDRTNDRVRVAAGDLRARAVAEGGNLGFTQKARIEYWLRGGAINTDAVDNSGGVDMSDHEVNIKILVDLLLSRGLIPSRAARNALLAEMAEEVAELVLADNAAQARALTLDGFRSSASYEEFVDVIGTMAAAGVLSRADDQLLTREEMLELTSRTRGIPRPVLAVVMAHAKNQATAEVVQSPLVESPVGHALLTSYFPRRLRDEYHQYFRLHPLRREIIATGAANCLINQAGISFIPRIVSATGQSVGAVIAAYLETDRELGSAEQRMRALEAGQGVRAELDALLQVETALEARTRELLQGQDASAGVTRAVLRKAVSP